MAASASCWNRAMTSYRAGRSRAEITSQNLMLPFVRFPCAHQGSCCDSSGSTSSADVFAPLVFPIRRLLVSCKALDLLAECSSLNLSPHNYDPYYFLIETCYAKTIQLADSCYYFSHCYGNLKCSSRLIMFRSLYTTRSVNYPLIGILYVLFRKL